MSTVALRGTLLKDNDQWQWKGMWAFGSSLATAAAQSQQPFLYTFHVSATPDTVVLPGFDEAEESNAVNDADDESNEQLQVPVTVEPSLPVGEETKVETKQTADVTSSSVGTSQTIVDNIATTVQKYTKIDGETTTVNPEEQAREQTQQPDSTRESIPGHPSKANKPSFALVPTGHPPFLEASTKYSTCPPSGHWKGHFSNAARPREKPQKIQEEFYLCLNGAPGTDVKYTFDENPLPPTVHLESLVLVRGTGTNPFGTFELIGYLDTTTHVMEIQRQYVLLPIVKPKRTRKSLTHKKSYFTRKRQPSWKLKQQEEEDRPLKKAKIAGVESETSSVTTIPVTYGMDASALTMPLVSSTTPTTMSTTPSAATTTAMATTTPVASDGIGMAPLSVAILPPPTSSRKRAKTPRKRSSSVASVGVSSSAASAASATTSNNHSTNTNTTNPSSNSPFIKLPPVGDPKKARWRAAHFLYYQRHDPDDVLPELSTNAGKTTATPNPRYVIYEGEMVNSQREGRGVCLFSNGMLYEGQWKRNKEHGRGQLWTADRKKLIYDGDWERGRMQGQGTYYYPAGKYIGEFKENMRNGLGQYILPDGSIYNGMWSQGKMNGRGVFTWPDLSVYDGEWKDGERHGQGILKTSDGFVYDGIWVHNAMEGRGIAQYPNGQTYEGLFANGRREGRGTMKFTNGAVYEGRFRDDAVDGQGTMKMSRALIVPNDDDDDHDNDNGNDKEQGTSKERKLDFMIPISFQSDMTHIHAKAGFTAVGD